MTLTDPAPHAAPDARQELLDQLAEPGLDLDAARAEFDLRRGRRRRTRQVLGATAAVLVAVLAVGAVVLRDGAEPDELVADRDEEVTSTSTSTTAVPPVQLELDPVAAPSSTVAPMPTTTAVVVAPVDAPASTAPPPTAAPHQPLQASLTVLTPEVQAGAVAAVQVSWSDADLSAAPRHVVAWGDPLVSAPVDPTPVAPCDLPGPPSSGVDTLQFRYSTPGVYRVQVTVETCGGQGAHGERVSLTAEVPIQVLAPDFVDPDDPALVSRGRSVVVFTPPRADAEPWPALSGARLELVTTIDPAHPVVLRDLSGPVVYTTSGPATVLVVPEGAAGTIRARWSDPLRCATTASGDLEGEDGAVLALPLTTIAC